MRNIPVGKKIMLGFGAVILMIVIIMAVSTVTSISRNNDLNRAETMNSLQGEASRLLDDFNLARVEIRTVFTSANADDEYALAAQYLQSCQSRLQVMLGYADQLGGYTRDEIAAIADMVAQVETGLDAVHVNDGIVMDAIAAMSGQEAQISEAAQNLYENVTNASVQIGIDDPAAGMGRVTAAMVPAKEIGDMSDNICVLSRPITLSQDISAVPDVLAAIDALDAAGNDLHDKLTTQEARTAVTTLLGVAQEYRQAVAEVEEAMQDSERTIAETRTLFLKVSEAINSEVDLVMSDVSALNNSAIATSEQVTFIMIGIGVIAVLFAVAVTLVLGKSITRPLSAMQAVMLQAGSTGNLEFSAEMKEKIDREATAKDELGQSINAFVQFVRQVTYNAKCLQTIAAKNLSLQINVLGEEDTMGVALRTMLDNLNEIFAEISNIAKQVSSSSQEVAVGAQTLAQGSTEQAATVQEISASVTEINEQMSLSNDTATDAARQGDGINHIALEGNEKMTHMMGAMQEINDASQAIGRVIKVIDDIAFQTNILALNAAVEAARAGQHGKGFAVVADEVRNLAAKSADAAKETANLISKNIEKTEQGLAFTQDTAESLTKIIEGIGQTNESLQTVAEQSQRTRTATSQVTQAIDQVAQVIQQNSATSEQSAAASEEMSSQAQVLQQAIAQFKLRGMGGLQYTAQEHDDSAEHRSDMAISAGGADKYDF